MKVVLDTNVLISALLWKGSPHRILEIIEKGSALLCITPAILEELADVLNRPKFVPHIRARNTSCEEILAGIVEIAKLYPNKKIASVVKEDPDDDKFLACAKFSGAEYLITGDPHLLELKNWCGVSILSPKQFLNMIHPK